MANYRPAIEILKQSGRYLTRIPFRLHWITVLFLAVILPWLTRNQAKPGEWFPFSNFPMYSNFEKTAYYVFVTDLNDEPLPMTPIFGNWPSGVKKIYDAKLKEEVDRLKKAAIERGERYRKRIVQMDGEECRPAGDATLIQMVESSRNKEQIAKYPGFRLYQSDITLEDGMIVKRRKMVGEFRN